ncbi:MAG: trimeric autotransporter adhesin [Actinomycetota bacterium]|nr:trimeric autotransporter adhesin [Actinomycetota bacterium]
MRTRTKLAPALAMALVLATGTATASGVHYKNVITRTHPIAYWRLGERSGSIAHTVVGRHPGTYKGAPRLGRPGLIRHNPNTAPHFDGVDDRIKANSLTNRTKAGWSRGYTLEAWVVTRTTTAEEHIMSFNHRNGGTNIAIFRDEPSNRFKFHDCEGRTCVDVYSKTTPVIGKIYQVAVTVNGSNRGHLYVNGRAEASFVSAKRPVHRAKFTIGADYDKGPKVTSFWHGKIDEAVVYAHALTAREIAAQWAAGT